MFLDSFWAGLGGMVLPSSLGYLLSFLCWLFPAGPRFPLFPWFRLFNLPSPSFFSLTPKKGTCSWGLVKFSSERGREERACCWAHVAELLSSLWEGGKNKSMQLILRRGKGIRACSLFWEECPFFSPCCIYTPLKCKRGCLDVGPRLSLSPFWVILELVSILILL